MKQNRRRKEHFISTSINNINGCAEQIIKYPCCDKNLFETIEYPYENQNYDLESEVYDWGPNQYVPTLLGPVLKEYKKENPCFVNTANLRSTLFPAECLNCNETNMVNKSRFQNRLFPENNLICPTTNSECTKNILVQNNIPFNCYTDHNMGTKNEIFPPYCGYVYREYESKYSRDMPSILYDLPGYDDESL